MDSHYLCRLSHPQSLRNNSRNQTILYSEPCQLSASLFVADKMELTSMGADIRVGWLSSSDSTLTQLDF